jgi:hypothetical protein
MFFDMQAFPKNRGHMLTTKIDKITILLARPIRLVRRTSKTGPLY